MIGNCQKKREKPVLPNFSPKQEEPVEHHRLIVFARGNNIPLFGFTFFLKVGGKGGIFPPLYIMVKTKRRRKTKRRSKRQNIIRQRRYPTRIIYQQARHRDHKGRHYKWLLSLGARTRWNPRSIGKFSVG